MTESIIQQLYCTHCTYGTAYVHQRESGAIKDNSFDYSVRAASVSKEKCLDYFRNIQSYLFYHLPHDTPGTELLRLDAQNTSKWRRMLFIPSVSGIQVVANIAFRTKDTQGRPGSYFAHVLFSDRSPGQPPAWTATDALKLWGSSNWVVSDGTFPKLDLDTFRSLDEFKKSEARPQRTIDDDVLLSFLKKPTGMSFDDPGQVIPARWKDKTPEERQELLIDTLQGFLSLDFNRRQTMLLGIESSLAALIFYGVARLLPVSPISDRISFSTFETHQDQPKTALAAMDFNQPDRAELPRDPMGTRGFAINTFNPADRTLPLPWKKNPAEAPQYARKVVERFIKDQHGLNEFLDKLAKCQPEQPEALEELLRAENSADEFLYGDGAKALASLGKLKDHVKRYLRASVEKQLEKAVKPTAPTISQAPPPPPGGAIYFPEARPTSPTASLRASPEFTKITSSTPRVLSLLCLVAGEDASPAAQPVIARLLEAYHAAADGHLHQLLEAGDIALAHKVSALRTATEHAGHLPSGCEWILASPDSKPGGMALLTELLREADDSLFEQLRLDFEGTSPDNKQRRPLLQVLTTLSKESNKTERLAQYLDGMPTESLKDLLRQSADIRKSVFEQYARYHKQLDDARTPLYQLIEHTVGKLYETREFVQHLDWLYEANATLQLDHDGPLAAWRSVRSLLQELKQELENPPGKLAEFFNHAHRDRLNDIGQRIADAACRAMPGHSEQFHDDVDGKMRAGRLRELMTQVIRPFAIPEVYSGKLAPALAGRGWRARPVRGTDETGRPRKSNSHQPYEESDSKSAAVWLIPLVLIALIGGGVGYKLWSERTDTTGNQQSSKEGDKGGKKVVDVTKQGNSKESKPANDPAPPDPKLDKNHAPEKVASSQKTDPDQVKQLVTQNQNQTGGHGAAQGTGDTKQEGNNNTGTKPTDPNKETKPAPMPKDPENKPESNVVASVTPKNPPDNNNNTTPPKSKDTPKSNETNKSKPDGTSPPPRLQFQPNHDVQVAFAALPPFPDEKLIVAELPDKRKPLELKLLGFEHAKKRLPDKLFSVSITKDDKDRPAALDVMHPGKDSQGAGSRSLCTIEIKDGLATFQWHKSEAPHVKDFVDAIRGCVLQIKYGPAGNKESLFVAFLPPKRLEGPLTLDFAGEKQLNGEGLKLYFNSGFVVPYSLRIRAGMIDLQSTYTEYRILSGFEVPANSVLPFKSPQFHTGGTIDQYETGTFSDWHFKMRAQLGQLTTKEKTRLAELPSKIAELTNLVRAGVINKNTLSETKNVLKKYDSEANLKNADVGDLSAIARDKLDGLKKEQEELKGKPKADRDAFLASGLKVSGEFYRIVGGHIESSKVNGGIAVLAFTIPDTPGAAPPMTPQAPTASPTQAQPMMPPDPGAVAPNSAAGNTTIPIPAANPQKVNAAGI